jgi:hypothetical protein
MPGFTLTYFSVMLGASNCYSGLVQRVCRGFVAGNVNESFFPDLVRSGLIRI